MAHSLTELAPVRSDPPGRYPHNPAQARNTACALPPRQPLWPQILGQAVEAVDVSHYARTVMTPWTTDSSPGNVGEEEQEEDVALYSCELLHRAGNWTQTDFSIHYSGTLQYRHSRLHIGAVSY